MIGNISKSKGFKGDKGDPFTYEDLTDEQKAELLGGAKFADKEELESHKYNANNPHGVTKEQVGLSNVDNTSDKDKPISDAVKEELGNKVDKVDGKVLSTNDFTNEDKQKLTDTRSDMDTMIEDIGNVKENLNTKVNKVDGKGLSTNDFTDEYRELVDENSYLIGNMNDLLTESTNTLVDAINEVYTDIHPPFITDIPTTLEANNQYNFGEVTTLNLAFPTIVYDEGGVIYLTFKSGATPTALTIDTTNTSDIEVIPEANTGYEIFGKYNGEIWIVNYSEYTVSEV